MGVYIEGLDMPKEGEHIIALIKNDGKVFYFEQDIETTTCKIMKDTEAIQIPTPHGRLIDSSELIKSYMKGTKTDIDDFYDTIDIIDNALTILEEEK